MEKKEKKFVFKSDSEREVAVCIAIQKIGLASVEEIFNKINDWNGSLSEKQIKKIAENIRRRGLISIDLSEKNADGISIQRYGMKSIKLSIPEVAQIKDLVDDPSVNPLKDELDRSKKTQKKGMKTYDYYEVNLQFITEGDVEGFNPDDQGIIKHNRDSDNNIIFLSRHFQNWFRDNVPLINKSPSSIIDIKFQNGTTLLKDKVKVIERYITNVQSGFSGSNGTGGRGSKKIEVLPVGTLVNTTISLPREYVSPQKIKKAMEIICNNGSAFGGGHKLSTGKLKLKQIQISSEKLWDDE